MIATPHFKSGHRNASPQNVKELIQSVGKEAAAQGTDIKLYRAMRFCFMMRCVRNLIMEE